MATTDEKEVEVKEEPLEDDGGGDDEWMRKGFELNSDGEVKLEIKSEPKEDDDGYSSGSDYEIDSDSEEEDGDSDENEGDSLTGPMSMAKRIKTGEGYHNGKIIKAEEVKRTMNRKTKESEKRGSKTVGEIVMKANNVKQKALMKLCKEAPLTDWVGSQCKYLCFKCKRHFRSWGSLNHHLRMELSHGPATAIEKHITSVVCYKCRICQKKMLADRGFLLTHIQERHGLGLEDYAEKYLTTVGHGRYKVKQDHMELAKAQMSQNKVGNMCLFRCQTCREQYHNWASLNEHLSERKHGPNGMENVGDYITKIVSHKCFVCSKVMLCDTYFLIAHIKSHKIGLPAYCIKYKCSKHSNSMSTWRLFVDCKRDISITKDIENMCKYKCHQCKYQSNSWKLTRGHLNKEGHYSGTNKVPSDYFAKVVLHQCQLCPTKVICDNTFVTTHLKSHNLSLKEYKGKIGLQNLVFREDSAFERAVADIPSCELQVSDCMPQNSLPESKTTTKMGNLCCFRCHTCKEGFVDWALLRDHSLRSHKVNMGQGLERDCVVKARYHKCLVCNRYILADPCFMSKHLRDIHREITFDSYCSLVRNKVSSDAILLAPKNRRKILVTRWRNGGKKKS